MERCICVAICIQWLEWFPTCMRCSSSGIWSWNWPTGRTQDCKFISTTAFLNSLGCLLIIIYIHIPYLFIYSFYWVRVLCFCLLSGASSCLYFSYRLFAVDHDIISLVDMNFEQWPVILVTNPKNALFHVPDQEPTQRIGRSTHIRQETLLPL